MRFLRLAGLLSLLVLAAPCFAQTSPTPPPPPPPAAAPSAPQPKPGDAFGEEVTLTAKTIVFSKDAASELGEDTVRARSMSLVDANYIARLVPRSFEFSTSKLDALTASFNEQIRFGQFLASPILSL